jgi:uncharacterized repeat protein (TIGR02543 family)
MKISYIYGTITQVCKTISIFVEGDWVTTQGEKPMAQGIALKNKGNRAFSALILSLGLITGLAPTANALTDGEYEIVWNDNGATTPSEGGSGTASKDSDDYLTGLEKPSQSPRKIGYNFDGWVTSFGDGKCTANSDEISNISSCDFTLSGSTFTFFAQWTPLLTALTASSGTSVSLSPTFASSTTSYTASVGNSTTSITVTPAESDDVTVVKYLGSTGTTEFEESLDLSVGENIIRIVVTGSDGIPQTYTVNVDRAAGATPEAYTITWNDQGATSASSGGSTTYTSGSTITTIPTVAPEKTGYTFAGWNTSENGSGSSVTSGSYTPLTPFGAITVYAKWTLNNVTATFNSNYGTPTTSTQAIPYSTSTALTANAFTRTGYTFAGWTANADGTGTSYTDGQSVTITSATNYYAKWTLNNVTATFNSNYGTPTTSTQAIPYSTSTALTANAFTRTGYTFAGWTANADGTGTSYTDGQSVTITSATNYYAKWTANQANNTNTVTWNSQGATTASSGGSTTYTNGSSVSTIPTTAPQKSGHTFIGWFTGATSGVQVTNASFTPASPYADITFYAHWTVNRSSSVGTWAWTNQSSAGERKWHALATSADGSKLFAGVDDGGSLYRSTDFGVTWSVIAGTSGKNWFSIASNIDGTKVAAVDRGGDIWTSTNSGSTWTQRSVGAVRNWESIASSSDGAKLVAVASNGDNNGYIYTSSNSGVSWSSDLAPAGTNKFTGVASSNDGTYLAATTWANGIYTSSNSGQTWTARTLPVPNPSGVTYLQAVASSGDGSRLVTGSRTQAGGSNGGVIFTSADYGATWRAFSQTSYDFINFTSNGDGSRLAASIHLQAGVSTSADFGATWTFQSVGLNGDIPIASNIDGSLLFVGGYGGNLWTGKIPNARVVAVLPASTSATLAAGASTPATALSFSASNAAAAMTVTPISNPATEAATPFSVAQASVFDISVVNVSGQVTVCVDGGPNVRLWHFTNGAWVDVTTSQTATQTCGVTSSFSPFATGPVATPLLIATPTVVDTGSARREAEMQSARADITSKLQSTQELSVETFAKAEIRGITASNIAAVQAEILALPEEARTDIKEVLKVARKFEVVGNIASTQVRNMSATSFVEIGLIPASSKNKVALVAAIRKLPASARDTYAEIKAAIDAETVRIKSRSDRLAAIVARKTTKSTQK